MGRLSDARGRKPFLLLSFLCSGAQAVAMLLYLRCGVSLLWFFPAQARPPRPPARPGALCCGMVSRPPARRAPLRNGPARLLAGGLSCPATHAIARLPGLLDLGSASVASSMSGS